MGLTNWWRQFEIRRSGRDEYSVKVNAQVKLDRPHNPSGGGRPRRRYGCRRRHYKVGQVDAFLVVRYGPGRADELVSTAHDDLTGVDGVFRQGTDRAAASSSAGAAQTPKLFGFGILLLGHADMLAQSLLSDEQTTAIGALYLHKHIISVSLLYCQQALPTISRFFFRHLASNSVPILA